MAAMIDLGVDEAYLKHELDKLGLKEYRIEVSRDSRHSIGGTRVDVVNLNEHPQDIRDVHSNDHGHSHENNHSHGHEHPHDHHHSHEHPHSQDHAHGHKYSHKHHGAGHSHEHRNLADIYLILDKSGLSQHVIDLSKRMFRLIAEAEAKVHDTSVDEIHFHEVGAVDSIVDIVGAAVCLDYLNVDKIVSSPVELGGGFVKCAHGLMPVPAPATAEILRNIPFKTGAVEKETTTPTGAAILAANVDEFTDQYEMEVEKIGYGIGHRKMEIPNILRVYMGNEKTAGKTSYSTHKAFEISCNVDDMSPEHYEHIMNQLFSAGADEVYITSVMMKKTRPGSKMDVLCKPDYLDSIINLIFTQTSTFGLRYNTIQKCEMERSKKKINTRYGEVTVKIGYMDGAPVKYKPEYEDCRNISKKHNLPVREVFHSIMNDIRRNL